MSPAPPESPGPGPPPLGIQLFAIKLPLGQVGPDGPAGLVVQLLAKVLPFGQRGTEPPPATTPARAAPVIGPTTPSATRLLDVWKATTAALVKGPKLPSAVRPPKVI